MKIITVRELRYMLFGIDNQDAQIGFADTKKGLLSLVAMNVSEDGSLVTLGFLNEPVGYDPADEEDAFGHDGSIAERSKPDSY